MPMVMVMAVMALVVVVFAARAVAGTTMTSTVIAVIVAVALAVLIRMARHAPALAARQDKTVNVTAWQTDGSRATSSHGHPRLRVGRPVPPDGARAGVAAAAAGPVAAREVVLVTLTAQGRL